MTAETPETWGVPETFLFEGQTVRFGSLGEPHLPATVLLHGTPFSSVVWRRIAPYLARKRHVFYYDLLGYGRSEMRPGQDVSLEIQGRLFTALLRHWGLARPDVVAHDFGGCTSLRAHLLHGSDYRSLTLIDPVALSPWGSPLVRHVRQHEAAFAGLPEYIHSAILSAYISGAACHQLSSETLRLYVEPWMGERGQPAFYRQIAQMDQRYTAEIENRYGEVRCPVSIIWGSKDQWIAVERGRELASRIKGSVLVEVPDAGHLVQEDAPEAIVATVLSSLSPEK
jgi:pimeloyl-ACP methyl ester carboxylesterase